eukprot:2687132-Prymnesium_polylepis.1
MRPQPQPQALVKHASGTELHIVLAYFLMKPSGGAPLFSRHLWSHGIALAAAVGFKGVEIVMGSVGKKVSVGPFSSWTSQVGHH